MTKEKKYQDITHCHKLNPICLPHDEATALTRQKVPFREKFISFLFHNFSWQEKH